MIAALFFAVCVAVGAHGSVGFGDCQAQFIVPQPSVGSDAKTIESSFMMHSPPGAVSICRDGVIAIQYDPTMLNPAWSAYTISPLNVSNNIPGRKSFYLDPDLKKLDVNQARSSWEPYNSTWNRGHLAPSQMLSYTNESKHATYTMANVAPQYYTFNQQPWRALEDDLFKWIGANGTLYIVTGIAYNDRNTAVRSTDNVSIPSHYWKVACDVARGESVGFYGVNDATSAGTATLRPVAAVEQLFGGALFPDDVCHTSHVNGSHWFPGPVAQNVITPAPPTTSSPSFQSSSDANALFTSFLLLAAAILIV